MFLIKFPMLNDETLLIRGPMTFRWSCQPVVTPPSGTHEQKARCHEKKK